MSATQPPASTTAPPADLPPGLPAYMATAPAVGPLPALAAPNPLRFRLSNGLDVIAIPRHAAPIVSMNLIIRSGADHDPAERAGLASLTAEMLDEGAGTRDALAIAESLERLGADLWLGAGRDGSQLTLQVPTAEFDAALDIAADVVLRPRLATEDWERVHHDRMTALAQRRDQPEAVADLVTALTVFGADHPYGRAVDGFEATVAAIRLEDVARFHAEHWRPNNAILAMAGEFDPEVLRTVLERALGAWAPGPAIARPEVPAPATRPRLVMVDRPDAPQTVVRVCGAGSSRLAPERPALSMLNVVLGGTFTSRLNFMLREKKGYTYGASSSFSFFRRPSAFVVRTSVFTKVTAPAVADILAEIDRMRAEPVDAQELTKARASLLDRTAEALSTAAGTAGTYADIGLYELPLDEPSRFIAALTAADDAALRALAARYLQSDQLTIIVVGDRAAIEADLRALGLPAPVMRDTDGTLLPPSA